MSRPAVTLKLATSLDGRIALADGRSKWITGPQARAEVHRLRADHDCVLTGVGTVLADDPQMTARPDGVHAPVQSERAVVDTWLRTPPGAAMFKAGPVRLFHVDGGAARAAALLAAGALLEPVTADGDGRADLHAVLRRMAELGLRNVMIEAGGTLAGAAVRAGVVDRIEWFRAPRLIGAEGRPCIAALSLECLADTPIFTRTHVRPAGADLWETYQRG